MANVELLGVVEGAMVHRARVAICQRCLLSSLRLGKATSQLGEHAGHLDRAERIIDEAGALVPLSELLTVANYIKYAVAFPLGLPALFASVF